MSFYTKYNRPAMPGLKFDSRLRLADSSFKKTSGINEIIARVLSGDISAVRNGRFIDCSNAPESYMDAINTVTWANQSWLNMPDSVRSAYGSPAGLLKAIDLSLAKDKANKEQDLIESNDVKGESPETK